VKGRLTISDVTNGYAVRIQRKVEPRTWFLASSGTLDNPAAPAFFLKYRAARTYVKALKEHGMTGRVVKAQLILKAE
jgi:hypothetical protein